MSSEKRPTVLKIGGNAKIKARVTPVHDQNIIKLKPELAYINQNCTVASVRQAITERLIAETKKQDEKAPGWFSAKNPKGINANDALFISIGGKLCLNASSDTRMYEIMKNVGEIDPETEKYKVIEINYQLENTFG